MSRDATTIRKLENGRAEFAYECVKQIASEKSEKAQKYKSYVKKVSAYIKTNGLGATLAFMKSKSDYQPIYEHLTKWLMKDDKKLIDLTGNKQLVEEIIKVNSPTYRAVTMEVLAFVGWLKRFADGLIEGEE